MTDLVSRLRRSRWLDRNGSYTTSYDMTGIEAERLDAADEIDRLKRKLAEVANAVIDAFDPGGNYECDHGMPPRQCQNEQCNVRTAYLVGDAIKGAK